MNEEIILESLKHNIPVEYVRSCDTSDGIGYYEEDTESWQYQLYNYITNLQKQNTELKEKIILLQASEPMLEFAKQTYKDNWNKLKEWLEEEYERCDKIGSPAIGCAMGQIRRIKSKMQEIEGGMNE